MMARMQALASEGGDPLRLHAILRRAPVVMAALRAALEVDAPDWLVCAGALRDVVWDALHGRPLDAPSRDVDVGFFDPSDLTPGRDRGVEEALRARAPHLPWEVKNQAAVHLWYPRRFGIEVPALASCADGVATLRAAGRGEGARAVAEAAVRRAERPTRGYLVGTRVRPTPSLASYQQPTKSAPAVASWSGVRRWRAVVT
jgi:uncharacterized protein